MNEPRRVFLKAERTPAELADLRAEREQFSRERPALDDLVAGGEYEGPLSHGDVMTLLSAVARMKQERERRGLTLAAVAESSGLDKGMISRLENGKLLNPTISTLWRYARAVGVELRLDAHAMV
jgi:DNA-binding XRE family transcriptional regulator